MPKAPQCKDQGFRWSFFFSYWIPKLPCNGGYENKTGHTMESADFQETREYPFGSIIYTMSTGSDRYRHSFRLVCPDPFVRDSVVYRTNSFRQKEITDIDGAWMKAQKYAENKIRRIHRDEVGEERTLKKRWERLADGSKVEKWRWVAVRKKMRRKEEKSAFEDYLNGQKWSYWFTLTYAPTIPTTLFNYWKISGDLEKIKTERDWDTLLEGITRTRWDWVEDMERFSYQLSRLQNAYRICWVMERHKSGAPHIHGLIWSSCARTQRDLSERDGSEWRKGNIEMAWKNIRGGRVDVQRIDQEKKKEVCAYITKYVAKDFGRFSAGITWDIRTIGRENLTKRSEDSIPANVQNLLREKYMEDLTDPKREKFSKILKIALTEGTRSARKYRDKQDYDFREVFETDCGTLQFIKTEQDPDNGYTPRYGRGFEHSSRIR